MTTSCTLRGAISPSPGVPGTLRGYLVAAAILATSCSRTYEFSDWLRIRKTDEITIIPHMLTLGGGPATFEARVEDQWVTVLRSSYMSSFGVTEQAFLVRLGYRGTSYVLLRKGEPSPVKFWSAEGAEMMATDARGIVRVSWFRSRDDVEVADRVRVEIFDEYGVAAEPPRELLLPDRPGCFFDRLFWYENGAAILADSCLLETLALTHPEPTRMPRPQ
jgi:hypothetical protein